MLIFKTFSGKLFDYISARKITSLTNLRKIFNTIGILQLDLKASFYNTSTSLVADYNLFMRKISGFAVPGICISSLYFVSPDDITGHLALFTIAVAFHELAIGGGFYFSHPDVSGPFAGSIFGFANSMDVIPGVVNPTLVAYLTPHVRENINVNSVTIY